MHVVANRWYPVLDSGEVRSGAPLAARRMAQDLVFWRDAVGSVRAALDLCPHRRARLSAGRVRDGCLECPFHGFQFDGDGACVKIPAHPDRPISPAMQLRSIPAREGHGFVWLWTGPDPAPADPLPFFDFEGFRSDGSHLVEEVATHYTRAVENQLDFAHLSFVHETTIGMAAPAAVDSVEASVEGDLLEARADGFGGAVFLLGPALWRMRTGAAWQFLAFVPIDEHRTRLYLRVYTPSLPVPGLNRLVGWLNRWPSRLILRQDLRVIEGHPTGETRLRMGEVLVRSDRAIIEYRRWREQGRIPFDPGAVVARITGAPDESADSSLAS